MDKIIFNILKVKNKQEFFTQMLNFFLPLQPIFTVYMKLPKDIKIKLKDYQLKVSFFDKYIRLINDFTLNTNSIYLIIETFTDPNIINSLQWGLSKRNKGFLYCPAWNDVFISPIKPFSIEIIENKLLELKEKNIISLIKKIKN